MGLINDLKSIFFGASSISKHAVEKASDFVQDEGAELLDKTKHVITESGETIIGKSAEIKKTIADKSSELVEASKKSFGDLGESLNSNPVVNKMKDFTEYVGEQVINKGEKIIDSSISVSEKVGEKVLDVKDQIVDKAMELKDTAEAKLETAMDKADKWAEEEKLKPKKEFADDTLDASGSLLEESSDFFSKAEQYASGEYDSFSEGKITVQQNIDKEKQNFIDGKPALGFKDLDGDGNELIDDAIIDKEL